MRIDRTRGETVWRGLRRTLFIGLLLTITALALGCTHTPQWTPPANDMSLAEGDATILQATPELNTLTVSFDGKQLPAWYDESLTLYFHGQRVAVADFHKALVPGRAITLHALRTSGGSELYLRKVWVK